MGHGQPGQTRISQDQSGPAMDSKEPGNTSLVGGTPTTTRYLSYPPQERTLTFLMSGVVYTVLGTPGTRTLVNLQFPDLHWHARPLPDLVWP